MSFAKIVVSGTLSSDPEKRFTPNNHAVTSFTLMVENQAAIPGRPGPNNEPFPVRVTCWRGLAETVTTRLVKGEHVLVEGKLMLNSFQAQDGTQKKLFEIEAANIDKLPGLPETLPVMAEAAAGNGGYNANGGSYGQQAQPAATSPSSSGPAPASNTYATPPSSAGRAPAQGSSSHFSSEDLLTEDDIPF